MSQVGSKKIIAKAMQDKLNKFDFHKDVVATHDVGFQTPIECKLVFPRDKFDINVSQFTFLEPLPCPTFGRIKSVTRAFFVPMHQLFSDWENFISNQRTASSNTNQTTLITPSVPYVTVYGLSNAILHNSLLVTKVNSTQPYDIVASEILLDVSETQKAYFQVTPFGRRLINMLNGLGYNFPWVYNSIYGETFDPESGFDAEFIEICNTKLSLLPLLAYWKFYLDWCVPSRYIRTGWIKLWNLLQNIFKSRNNIYVSDSDCNLKKSFVTILVSNIPVSYFNEDYFTQAFKTPYGYEDDIMNSGISIPNSENLYLDSENLPHSFANTFVSQFGDSPQVRTENVSDNTSTAINMFSVRSLGALQDLVNRGKLAGSKIKDYLRVTYGITPSNDALNVSTYLGSHSFDIKIGDVMSNSDTKTDSSGAYLGERAGRGLGAGTGKFTFTSDEHGFFFVVNELCVVSSYVQGLRPEVTALDRFDFFQPEFDNLGVEAISKKELTFTPLNYKSDDESDVQQFDSVGVFGFAPRYAKYKTNFDSVIGDFRYGRVNTGMDSWYLSRLFNQSNAVQWTNGINYTFAWQYGSPSLQNYDRIFQVANSSIDHFKTIFSFDFTAFRAMKSLQEPLEVVENHGSDVNVETQGVV